MLLDDYKKLDVERLAAAEEAYKFYKTVDLPGERSFESDVEGFRARIAAMKIERAKPNHE